ncbi:MAG: glycosyltransferase family 4 protein [Spirochaetota bacterium]
MRNLCIGVPCRERRLKTSPVIALVSGLPFKKKTSFYYQLLLLKRSFHAMGIETILVNPVSGEPHLFSLAGEVTTEDVITEHNRLPSSPLGDLLVKSGVEGAILLGYPDQFVSGETGIPLFLWTQLSKPPDPRVFKNFIPVPLTVITRNFLLDAGVQKVGPVIPHGVDSSVYHPLHDEERYAAKKSFFKNNFGKDSTFVAGTIGANTRRKQFDRLIQSFSLFCRLVGDLPKAGPLGVTLILKTDRTVSIDGIDLRKIAGKYGLSEKVIIIDKDLSEGNLADLYNIMDVYINLSEWEGFCIPVIEAMACGIPVITPPMQGPGEIVPYDDLFIAPGYAANTEGTKLFFADPASTSEILLKAFKDPALCKKLGETGRREVKNRYDIKTVARQWIELI